MTNIYVLQVLTATITGIFASCSVANLIAGGMSINEAAFAFGVLGLATAFLELPTGYFADRYGRKASALGGVLVAAIAYFGLFLFQAETLSYVAMAILAFGNALISGAQEAWFVNGYKSKYPKVKSLDNLFLNLQLCSRGGMITGGFVGPYLMGVNPGFVWLFAAVVASSAFLFGYMRVAACKASASGPAPDRKKKASALLSTPLLIFLGCCLLLGIEGGSRDIIIQPYILDVNFGAAYMLSVHQLLCVIFRMSGILVYKRFLSQLKQREGSICLAFALFAASQLLASQTTNYWVFMPLFCLAIFSLGWLVPLLQSYINSIVEERYRATSLSLANMVDTLGQASTCFALAATITRASLQSYWWIAGIAAGLSPIFYLLSVASKNFSVRSASTEVVNEQ